MVVLLANARDLCFLKNSAHIGNNKYSAPNIKFISSWDKRFQNGTCHNNRDFYRKTFSSIYIGATLKRAFDQWASSENPGSRTYPHKPVILIAGTAASAASIAKALECIGEHCLLARGLDDALGKLNCAPAACLIDLSSWSAGWKLLERLREQESLQEVPVFLFSSKQLTVAQKRRSASLNVEKLIVKPFNSTTIRRQIVNAILRIALKRGKPLGSIAS